MILLIWGIIGFFLTFGVIIAAAVMGAALYDLRYRNKNKDPQTDKDVESFYDHLYLDAIELAEHPSKYKRSED